MLVKKFKYILLLPILIIVAAIIVGIFSGGLNMGIDFTGGNIMTIDVGEEFDTDVIRESLVKYDAEDAPVVKVGDTMAEIRSKETDEAKQQELSQNILEDIQQTYPDAQIETIDRVGGIASRELILNAFFAVLLACVLMLIYIWIRFTLFSGLSAIICLLHDIIIMTAVVCIVRLQINSSYIAACLTIVGYSINNTIVLYDRIRENESKLGGKEYTQAQIADMSVKQTLNRTINTSVTTLITIAVLYILGVDSIKEFALPIIVGLIAGTYSSVLMAAPIWILLEKKFGKKDKKGKMLKRKRKVVR